MVFQEFKLNIVFGNFTEQYARNIEFVTYTFSFALKKYEYVIF